MSLKLEIHCHLLTWWTKQFVCLAVYAIWPVDPKSNINKYQPIRLAQFRWGPPFSRCSTILRCDQVLFSLGINVWCSNPSLNQPYKQKAVTCHKHLEPVSSIPRTKNLELCSKSFLYDFRHLFQTSWVRICLLSSCWSYPHIPKDRLLLCAIILTSWSFSLSLLWC